MYHFEKNILIRRKNRPAFTLIEVVTAIAILAAIITSVLVVMDRAIAATIDTELKMQAFNLARENMEILLASDSVSDMVEFGADEMNPNLEYRIVVESFSEPVTSQMWVRAICSASYTDSTGETQTIELTHWLNSLTSTQIKQINDQKKREQEYLDQFDLSGEDKSFVVQNAELLREYFQELGRDVETFDKLVKLLEDKTNDYLLTYEFDRDGWREFITELNEREIEILRDKFGFDERHFDDWVDKYVEVYGYLPGGAVSGKTGPSQPDTPDQLDKPTGPTDPTGPTYYRGADGKIYMRMPTGEVVLIPPFFEPMLKDKGLLE
jgi:prepilin-type N-terminal cleavage/methylation domain-containing protein